MDVRVHGHTVVLGENGSGKSNLVQALRLVLDPSLPDQSRELSLSDFWDGIENPLDSRSEIRIDVEFLEPDGDDDELALLADYLVATTPLTAGLSFLFRPKADVAELKGEADFEFLCFGGDTENNSFGHQLRRGLRMELLPALRDAEGDLARWRRSPLRPLLDHVLSDIDNGLLQGVAEQVSTATAAITDLDAVAALADKIENRIDELAGPSQKLGTILGFAPLDAQRLGRSLRLLSGNGKRDIVDESLGGLNLLYLSLKSLHIRQQQSMGERIHTLLAIEEPEAHLHPQVQRSVYSSFLSSSQGENTSETTLLTTHSPNIAAVAPVNSLVLLRKGDGQSEARSSEAAGLDEDEKRDVERYLDATRAELLFARRVLFVEGDAERLLLPVLAKQQGFDLDRMGISLCSVSGVHFRPYAAFADGLGIPFAIATDLDPQDGKEPLAVKRVRRILLRLARNRAHLNDQEISVMQPGQLFDAARLEGVFVNDSTLELEFVSAGHGATLVQVLLDCDLPGTRRTSLESYLAGNEVLDEECLMHCIGVVGKGRFAQLFAKSAASLSLPAYIHAALEFLHEA